MKQVPARALPDHVVPRDREALKFKELEHVLIEKVEQLFRDTLYGTFAGGSGCETVKSLSGRQARRGRIALPHGRDRAR